MLGIDYAFRHPDPAAIKAAGYAAVLRYLSHDPSKDLTAPELAALHAVGLAVGVVWETTAIRPLSGAAGGAQDGTEVGRRMTALGFPLGVPCFYAFDTDDRNQPGWQPKVAAYLAAAAQSSSRGAHPYGSIRVVDALGPGWQACAWSGSAVSTKALVYQRAKPTLPAIPGGGYDEDLISDASVLWAPAAPSPPVQEDTVPPILLNAPGALGIWILFPNQIYMHVPAPDDVPIWIALGAKQLPKDSQISQGMHDQLVAASNAIQASGGSVSPAPMTLTGTLTPAKP